MPFPFSAKSRLSGEYLSLGRQALGDAFEPSYGSMEGYVAGKTFVEGLRRTGPDITTPRMIAAFESMTDVDFGGFRVGFEPRKRSGSRLVDLTILTEEGRTRYEKVLLVRGKPAADAFAPPPRMGRNTDYPFLEFPAWLQPAAATPPVPRGPPRAVHAYREVPEPPSLRHPRQQLHHAGRREADGARTAAVRVRDAKTGEDFTRSILLQIILEEETGGVPMFSTQTLAQIIRFYGHAMQGMMGAYLEKNPQPSSTFSAAWPSRARACRMRRTSRPRRWTSP